MEGVMMRNGDTYGLAVRKPNGEICAQRLPWKSIFHKRWLRLPFLRGFPTLIETLINGVHALNRSSELFDGKSAKDGSLRAFFSLCIAIAVALALFVVAPHLLSLLMLALNLGGDVDGLSFHIWDGLYKTIIFMAYIWFISLIPDIHRVFQYHGAEHKSIHAFERCGDFIDSGIASRMSRLHPRCGTTFLLFVVLLSIALQAILVPLFIHAAAPAGVIQKHAYTIAFKLFLIIPVSAVAYELIKFAAGLGSGVMACIWQWPGLCLQRLTTREPDAGQIEVALVALAEALDYEDAEMIDTARYSRPPQAAGSSI